MKRRNCELGFTLLEALVVLAVVLVGLVIVGAFVLNVNRRPAATHFNMKDSSQVRGVMQAMVLWAQNNGGKRGYVDLWAVFRNWCLRDHQRAGNNGSQGNGHYRAQGLAHKGKYTMGRHE